MADFPCLARYWGNRPLLIDEAALPLMEARLEAQTADAARVTHVRKTAAAFADGGAAPGRGGNGVALIPILGVIGNGWLDDTAPDDIVAALRWTEADPHVSARLLVIDSPGGSVDLIQETAIAIRQSQRAKPIAAIARPMAASAAYWLGSQADPFVITPSGEAGSVGVIALHLDLSEQLAMRGIRPTLLSAGAYKTEGNMFEPLGSDAKTYLLAQINDMYDQFVAAVALGRNVSETQVRRSFGGGRMMLADQAVKAGLVDRVATIDDTIAKLSGAGRAARRAIANEAMDLELAIRARRFPALRREAPLSQAETDAADMRFDLWRRGA